jgi:hypothetical protein
LLLRGDERPLALRGWDVIRHAAISITQNRQIACSLGSARHSIC